MIDVSQCHGLPCRVTYSWEHGPDSLNIPTMGSIILIKLSSSVSEFNTGSSSLSIKMKFIWFACKFSIESFGKWMLYIFSKDVMRLLDKIKLTNVSATGLTLGTIFNPLFSSDKCSSFGKSVENSIEYFKLHSSIWRVSKW